MPKLNGADFIAETPIYLARGSGLVVIAAVGESCEKVPMEDLERLAARGKITRKSIESVKRGKKE